MNTKTLFKLGSMLLVLLFLVGTVASGQVRTWYVNNSTGSDGRNGQLATIPFPDDGITGPKRTIDRAITEGNSLDFISVAFTGINYSTTTGEPATITVTDKKLNFTSTGGTPVVSSVFQLAFTTVPVAADRKVTFQGPFDLDGGLTMTRGDIVGGQYLTLGGVVTFIAYPSGTANPSFDVAPAGYASAVNFAYDASAAAANVITTGPELNGPGINASLTNLDVGTSFASVALTFGGSYTMNGVLTTANTSTIKLGGYTLTISGTSVAHSLAGNVTGGTLAFAMNGGPATVAGAVTLPAVTATSADGIGADLLTLTAATSIGSLTASSDALITATAATIIGAASSTADNIVNHSTGTITLAAAITVNGNVVLDAALGPPDGGDANTGRIIFNAAAPITVNGKVTNSASIALEKAADNGQDGATGAGVTNVGIGIIWFPDVNVTIKGNVLNSFTVGGVIDGTTISRRHGQIRFSRAGASPATTTINGSVSVSSSSALSSSSAAAISGMGSIIIQNDGGDVRIDGGISSIGSWSGFAGASMVNNGTVEIVLRTGAKLGLSTNKVGAINNSSVAVFAQGNGDLLLGSATTLGGFNGTTITVSGAAAGGQTIFGNEAISATNVTNSRSNANVTLVFGPGVGGLPAATVSVSSLLSSGTAITDINCIVATAFTASSGVNMAGGTVEFPNATTAAFNLGSVTTTGGKLDLSGTGAASGTISVKNANFTGGTVDLGTGARSMLVAGTANTFGGSALNTTFSNGLVTILSFENPVPTAVQTVTFGPLEQTYPGPMQVNNSTGLTDAVRFTGGNFKVGGTVSFLQPVGAYGITLDGAKIYVLSATGALDFSNVNGYTTLNNGYVSMSGTGIQEVGGAGSFGGFEVNSTVRTTVAAATGPFTGFFYLTRGQVYNTGDNTSSANVVFDNSTTNPTIVVNAGVFNVVFTTAPTFTSAVNVTYIGTDKSTSLELPIGATKLNNLTVATTNGAKPSQGVVTTNVSTTVNGTLTIKAGQTLAIGATFSLTMKGASAVIDGYLVNKAAAVFGASDRFVLGRTAGTAVTGTGVICDVEVANNSAGNTINGPIALINQFLGNDGAWGGAGPALDFDIATPAAANGNIQVGTAGGGTEDITLTMGAGYAGGTTVNNITTTDANATFTLGSNLVAAGILTANAGTIAIGTHTLSLIGVVGHTIDGTASVTGTGLLVFQDATGLTVLTQAGTIATNVQLKSTAVGPMTLVLGTSNLTISGDLELKANSAVNTCTFSLATNLTCTGSKVTMGANTFFAGAGVLNLNASAPNTLLTFTYTLTPSIVNLTISNDVLLAGTGTTLTVSGTLKHVAGDLNFGSRDLTASGTYQRTAGTYHATQGYFIYTGAGANFKQGNSNFDIPNLKFENILAASATGTGVVNVTKNLYMNSPVAAPSFTHTVSGAATISVANGATVTWEKGEFDAIPAYGATIHLISAYTGVGAAVPLTIWPLLPATLVTDFSITGGGTTQLSGNMQVNTALYLTTGILDLNTGTRTLTMVNNSTVYRTFGGQILNAPSFTGVLAYGTGMTVVYQADGANAIPAAPNFLTGPELKTTIANLTFTRAAGASTNAWTQITTPVSVTGVLTIKNDVTTTDGYYGTLPIIPVNVGGDLVIAQDAGAGATPPIVAIGTLAFNGGGGATQQFTLAGNLAITNLTLNKAAGGMVYLTGGNLTIGNVITFINGLLVLDTTIVPPALPAVLVLTRGNPTYPQGFDHVSAWVYPKLSHVVGYVQHAIAAGDGAALTNGRFEFPVGSKTAYRPAAITFTPAYPANNPTNVLVKSVDGNPDGNAGFAIDGGNGVKIGNYPQYYWLMQASPSSFTSTQQFDLDLQGTNLNYPFTSVLDLRIIRRQDGNATSNQWQLQGTPASYVSNYISVPSPTLPDSIIFVRSTSLQGSITQQLTRFTIGIPVRPPVWSTAVNTNPAVDTMDVGMTHTLQFAALSQNSSLPTAQQAITYAIPSGLPAYASINASGLVTLHPTSNAQAGAAPLTVTATDIGGTITMTTNLYVWNVNSAPAFKPTNTITVTGVTDKAALSLSLYAADPDSATQTLTYSFLSITPAAAVANPTVTGHALAWAPTFADAATSFVIKVLVSDGVTTGHGPTPGTDTLKVNVTVARSRARGDVDGNTHIQAADASLVLQYVVHLPYLAGPPQQSISSSDPAALWAADANGTNGISSYDAALILQVAAGLPVTLPNVANADAHLGKAITVAASGDLSYSAPQPTSDNMVVNVPLKVAKAANVYAVQLTSRANMDQLSIEAVNMTIPEGWDMKWNVVGNELRIAMAGTTQLSSGDLGSVTIRLKSKESRLSFSTEAMLNEDAQMVSAVEIAAIPTVFALELNYPNPFNPSTTIKYQIATDNHVTLEVWNALGQKIRTLVSTEQKAGYYSVVWDGRNEGGQTVSSGLYLYRVQAGSFVATHKMLMLK